MFGYCNTCLQPILTKDYKMVRGKKVCSSCLAGQEKSAEEEREVARQNDSEKQGLFTLLLSLFPVGEPPLSWYNQVQIMNKKGFSCSGIILTLKYCIASGRKFNAENWSSLIYVYYDEAQAEAQERRKITNINEKKEIKTVVDTIRIRNTKYRDLPPYNIEDL